MLWDMRRRLTSWNSLVPFIALVALVFTWGRDLANVLTTVVVLLLGGAVLSAVHHAEVIAHRVGEPLGSLVLAVAVTVIEVGLIVTLMISADGGKPTLARDTVFAAVMITCNGIVGASLFAATRRGTVAVFNADGAGGALATVASLATLTLVLPTFTTSTPGPTFSSQQLTFAAISSLVLYGIFVFVQTVTDRESFMPALKLGSGDAAHAGSAQGDSQATNIHETPLPTSRELWTSATLLVVSLVAVVGLAKVVSPTIESGVKSAGLPVSFVGVVIALIVLLPETLSAVRGARRGLIQTSFNLAYGSAMASIGLTIPAIAFASIWLSGPLHLGLGTTEIVLLALTVIVSVLTVARGRATLLQAGVHLALFAAFLELALNP